MGDERMNEYRPPPAFQDTLLLKLFPSILLCQFSSQVSAHMWKAFELNMTNIIWEKKKTNMYSHTTHSAHPKPVPCLSPQKSPPFSYGIYLGKVESKSILPPTIIVLSVPSPSCNRTRNKREETPCHCQSVSLGLGANRSETLSSVDAQQAWFETVLLG